MLIQLPSVKYISFLIHYAYLLWALNLSCLFPQDIFDSWEQFEDQMQFSQACKHVFVSSASASVLSVYIAMLINVNIVNESSTSPRCLW